LVYARIQQSDIGIRDVPVEIFDPKRIIFGNEDLHSGAEGKLKIDRRRFVNGDSPLRKNHPNIR